MKVNSMEQRWGLWLVLIGALNWGLVGLGYFLNYNLNLVNLLLGGWPALENLVYLVIGICAAWLAYLNLNKKS
jgi:uncharacterized membrane protein YuzA (DUF378 family)